MSHTQANPQDQNKTQENFQVSQTSIQDLSTPYPDLNDLNLLSNEKELSNVVPSAPIHPDMEWLISNTLTQLNQSVISEYNEEDVGIKVGGIIIHSLYLKNLKKVHKFEPNSPSVCIKSGNYTSVSSEKTNIGTECEWTSLNWQIPISSKNLSLSINVQSIDKEIGSITLFGLDLASGKPIENGIYSLERNIVDGTEPTGIIEFIYQLIPPPPRSVRTRSRSMSKHDALDLIPSKWVINEVSLVDLNLKESEKSSLFKSIFGSSTELSASCILGSWQADLPSYIIDQKSRSAKWIRLNWKVPIPSPTYSLGQNKTPSVRASNNNSVILGSILEHEEASIQTGITDIQNKKKKKKLKNSSAILEDEENSVNLLSAGNSVLSNSPQLIYPSVFFRFILFNSLNETLGSSSILINEIANQKIDSNGNVELYANLLNEKGSMIGKIRFFGTFEYGGSIVAVHQSTNQDLIDSITIASSHNNNDEEYMNHISQAASISPSLENHYLSLTFPLTLIINSSLIFGLSKQFSSLSSWLSRINTKNYPIFHPSHNPSAKYNQGDGYFLHFELHVDRQIFSSPIPMEYNKSMVKWNDLNWRVKVNPDSVIRLVLSIYTLEGLNEILERENVYTSKNTRRKLFNKDSRLSPTKSRYLSTFTSIKTVGKGHKHIITSSNCKEIGRANISPSLLIKLSHNFNKFHHHFSPFNEYFQDHSYNISEIPALTLPLFIREGKGDKTYTGKIVAKALLSICLTQYNKDIEEKYDDLNQFEKTSEGIQTLIQKPKINGLTNTINMLTRNNQFLQNKKKYSDIQNNLRMWNSYYTDIDDVSSSYTPALTNPPKNNDHSLIMNNYSNVLDQYSHEMVEGAQLEYMEENDLAQNSYVPPSQSNILNDINGNSTLLPPLGGNLSESHQIQSLIAFNNSLDEVDDDSTIMTGNLTEKKLKLRKKHMKYYNNLEATNRHLTSNLNQDHDNYYYNYQNYNYMLNESSLVNNQPPRPSSVPSPSNILSPSHNLNTPFYNSNSYITFTPQLLPNFNPFEAINMGHQIILKIHEIDAWDLYSLSDNLNHTNPILKVNSPCVSLIFGKHSYLTEIVKDGDECCYWKDLNIPIRIQNFSSRLRISVNSLDFNTPSTSNLDETNYYSQNNIGIASLPIEAFLIPCLEMTNPNYLRQLLISDGHDDEFKIPFSGGWYDTIENRFKISINLGGSEGESVLEDDDIIIPPASDEFIDDSLSKSNKIKSSQSFHSLPSNIMQDNQQNSISQYYLNNTEKEDEKSVMNFMESYDVHYVSQNSLHTLPSGLSDILSTQFVPKNPPKSTINSLQQILDNKIKGKLKFSYSLQYVTSTSNPSSSQSYYRTMNPQTPIRYGDSQYYIDNNDKESFNVFHTSQFQQDFINNSDKNEFKLPPINPNGRPISASLYQKHTLSNGEYIEPTLIHSRPPSGNEFNNDMMNTYQNIEFQYTSDNIRQPFETTLGDIQDQQIQQQPSLQQQSSNQFSPRKVSI